MVVEAMKGLFLLNYLYFYDKSTSSFFRNMVIIVL